MENFVQRVLFNGGQISPLIIEDGYYKHIGYMNPSVFVDDDGDILVNLRHINYTLYHSEEKQLFPTRWGPLSYLHPETDQNLRTVNYICRLNKDLEITDYSMIDTSELDVAPLWEFIGLEDCRLVKWNNKYYVIGVRRDTTPHGQGRMELTEISIDKENWDIKELSRIRIPTTGDDASYCEKNWVPVLDKPYHFIKWTNPTELIRTYPDLPARCEQVSLKDPIKNFNIPDQRGGSQVIRWKDHYISISHEVSLYNNYLGQKDGVYRHRLLVWNDDFELVGVSPENFSFLDAKIEFCAGLAPYGDDLLITFGFQDNAAFILKTPRNIIDEMIHHSLGKMG